MNILNSSVSQLLQTPAVLSQNKALEHISTPDDEIKKIWAAYKARLCSKCRHPAVWHANGPCTCGCTRPKATRQKKGRDMKDLFNMEGEQ